MNLKNLKILVLTLFVGGVVFTACQDKFSEEDFLNKQYSLDTARTNKQIKALNDAGELLSFTVQVVEDNTPLAGVLVKMSNAVGSATLTSEATTDANGQAIFQNVKIGGNTLILSKTGYVTASATVVFPDPTTGNGNYIIDPKTSAVIPIKLARSARLPLFSNSATATASTAVIKGKVTIETDLTNTTPELPPAPIQIRANFAAAIALVNTTGVTVANYVFTEGTLGIATTDASGNYSITVPASSDGLAVTLDVPTIDGVQKVAVKKLNAIDITPEYRNVPTTWGPTVTADAIPTVIGATVSFPAPPAPGRGLTFTFVPVPRSLETGTVDETVETLPTVGASNTVYNLTNRGSGFTSSPTVAITGGGGTGVTATAAIQGTVNSINVSGGGTGYPATVFVRYMYTFNDAGGNPVDADFAPTMVISVPTTGGVLPTGNLTLPNSQGFPNNTMFKTPAGTQVIGFKIKLTDAGGTVLVPTTAATVTPSVTTELSSFTIVNGGSGFTSSATSPTISIAITGGGGTGAQASVTVFKNQFDLTLGGTSTTPYKVLPNNFRFLWAPTATESSATEASAKVDRIATTGTVTNQDLLASVTTDGTTVAPIAPFTKLRTTKMWTTAPTVEVIDAKNSIAKMTLVGTNFSNGRITSTPTSPAADIGNGYDTRFAGTIVPTITGAPGTGAAITLNQTVNGLTKLVTWDGTATIINEGSGYLPNLNQTSTAAQFSPAAAALNPSVKVGNTYVIDIKYGTGLKRETVD